MSAPKSVVELINKSGNNFHAKVSRWLIDNGWHVMVSPYYLDQSQGKAREIDLVAEKLWPVNNDFGRPHDSLVVRLFIECKYISKETVFWFADKNINSAKELVCQSGIFRTDNTFIKDHHYISKSHRVAKVFSSSKGDAGREGDPVYKALNQAVNGMVSLRGQSISHPDVRDNGRTASFLLEFPVVVCNAFEKVYGTDFDRESDPSNIVDNFQLEVQYAYVDRKKNARDQYFLLDFVSFDKLTDFMNDINKGAEAAAFLASR